MPVINLLRYIVYPPAGIWTHPNDDPDNFGFTLADTMSPGRLMLRWPGDFVALTGPLRIRVTVQAENQTVPLAYVGNLVPDATATVPAAQGAAAGSGGVAGKATIGAGATLSGAALGRIGQLVTLGRPQVSTIYSYTLDILAGQAWPFSLSEQLNVLRLQSLRSSRFEQLGNNLGFRVIIEPAFIVPDCIPIIPTSDLPCDFAVADRPNTAGFFPVACEPCQASVIGLPPSDAVALITPPAAGGCVRTRFFNGMFITREDLETEQRYHRVKSRLHNRAAGAGVVWGYGVGIEGSRVCVLPGYGVDCCGNDLTVTTTYAVDIAALLADPAAASLVRLPGPHRMHLLLEYVECPSDPRPVHGDPCSPEVSRCEMSRIRESVRLRLVPPRDYDADAESAPIARFLQEVRALREKFPLGDGAGTAPADRAPYRLQVTMKDTSGNQTSQATIRPSPQIKRIGIQGAVTSLVVAVQLDPSWTFVAGTITGQAPLKGVVQPPDPIDLSRAKGFNSSSLQITFTLPSAGVGGQTQLVFKISGWQAQTLFAGEDDPAASGDLTLTVNAVEASSNSLDATITINPLALVSLPCVGEPCSPPPMSDTSLTSDCGEPASAADPTPVLPWMNTDPTHETSAGDPKVLVLSALGGWLAQMLVREQAGTSSEITSPRREIAQGIYRIAWLLLFGLPEKADPAALGATLQRLLEAWCDGLLWKGPQCCGDPHGIVIGCVIVGGGTITEIDPFGGRRYVVHYPLLEHWGAQFGLAPPDVTLMRFFSKLCCLAGLQSLSVDTPAPPTGVVRLGGGLLGVGDPSKIDGEITAKLNGGNIVAQRSVHTPEMIASALMLITPAQPTGSGPSTTPGRGTASESAQYEKLVLADFVADQTVVLVVPVTP
jgi:hypothetical protein